MENAMFTRRKLLGSTLKMSAGLALASRTIGLAQELPALQLRLSGAAPVDLPPDFTGLGYEMSSVARIGLLSQDNRRYIELVKGLGPSGVIRVGGIVANYTRYVPNGTIAADPQNTVITRASLKQFAAFLKAIGWTAIWCVNFAQGTLDDAIKEARAVTEALGPSLLALEIGNEVDEYKPKHQPFRTNYTYDVYRKEYIVWHDAIAKAVPGVRFAAPDTARSYDWVEHMAADAHGDVQLLTTHYYRTGQTHGTADQLLRPDPRLENALTSLRTASRLSGIPWRMCETNSFSGGGRPGVSDTLIGALWTLDFMLLLALNGCSGVNIETGVNQLGFISSYSPIQDDGKGVNSAGAPYYGMLAFAKAAAGCRQVLPAELNSTNAALTAYVLGRNGKPLSVAIVNRDIEYNAIVSIAALGMNNALVLRSLAPAPGNQTTVTFGGGTVHPDGQWTPDNHELVYDGKVHVPHLSAVVLR